MICIVVVLVCCSKEKDANERDNRDANTVAGENADFEALPLTITTPADNPQTPQKIALGKLLFFDPVLSGNKEVACTTCHHPSLGFTDARDLSIGVNG